MNTEHTRKHIKSNTPEKKQSNNVIKIRISVHKTDADLNPHKCYRGLP